MKKYKKYLYIGVCAIIFIIFVILCLFKFSKTPEEIEKDKIKNRTEEAISLFYTMDVNKDKISEYALDVDVATEYINFSTRNYVNISADDDAESELITLRRKDELVDFFDKEMTSLLKIVSENSSYKIIDIRKVDDKYYVELEIHPFDMNAYYTYVADFVVLYVGEASSDDSYKTYEKAKVQFMNDVYTAKALAVKILNHYYIDEFKLDETYHYTTTLIEKDGQWMFENLDSLQSAFNGMYAKKYVDGRTNLDVSEQRRERVVEIFKECLKKGIIDASDIRSVDNILDK